MAAGQCHHAKAWKKSSKSLCGTLGVEDSSWWQMVAASVMTTSTWWSRAFCKGHFCYIREIRKGISKSQASSCGFLFNLQFLLQQLAGDWTHLRLCMFISLIFPVSGFAFLSLFYILCFCLLCSLRSLTVFTSILFSFLRRHIFCHTYYGPMASFDFCHFFF